MSTSGRRSANSTRQRRPSGASAPSVQQGPASPPAAQPQPVPTGAAGFVLSDLGKGGYIMAFMTLMGIIVSAVIGLAQLAASGGAPAQQCVPAPNYPATAPAISTAPTLQPAIYFIILPAPSERSRDAAAVPQGA